MLYLAFMVRFSLSGGSRLKRFSMKVRISAHLKLRPDRFGGVCYLAHRDDFYAANKAVFNILRSTKRDWTNISPDLEPTYISLAKLGICETTDPATPEEPYSGPAFLGEFEEIPAVADPLVLNCFSTAFCPLKCVYCHADDLMVEYRLKEKAQDLVNVIATITGGDPLSKPDRSKELINRLSQQKSLVLDTAGVDPIDPLLPILLERRVHIEFRLTVSDQGTIGYDRSTKNLSRPRYLLAPMLKEQ